MPGQPGVYAIRNLRTGAFYVGSTRDLRRRFAGHRGALRRGRHQTATLQAAWNEDGETAFEFTVLEELPQFVGHARLNDAEKLWDSRFRKSGVPAYGAAFHPRAEVWSDNDPLVTLSLLVSERHSSELRQIAKLRQTSLGAIVREAIRDYLAATHSRLGL